jgi:hypothetical protein
MLDFFIHLIEVSGLVILGALVLSVLIGLPMQLGHIVMTKLVRRLER